MLLRVYYVLCSAYSDHTSTVPIGLFSVLTSIPSTPPWVAMLLRRSVKESWFFFPTKLIVSTILLHLTLVYSHHVHNFRHRILAQHFMRFHVGSTGQSSVFICIRIRCLKLPLATKQITSCERAIMYQKMVSDVVRIFPLERCYQRYAL